MPHLYRPHEKTAPLTKGTTRWWYTNPTCGTSTTLHRPDVTLTHDFQLFHHYATNTLLLTHYTQKRHCLIKTLTRRFATFWLIPIPITTQPTRVYDQIFIDGTYLNGGCLLIAATTMHPVAWHWARKETTTAYTRLIQQTHPTTMRSPRRRARCLQHD